MKRLLIIFIFASAVCFGQEQSGGAAADSLALWRWVNFAILAAGLGYLMAKYLPPFFAASDAAIQKDIAEARQAKQDSDQRAASIDQHVSRLGAEIEAFRVQAHQEMEREGQPIREETATHIRKINAQAQVEIESASKAARREVRLYAANLALDLAAQRVRARLDANAETTLVDNFLGDLRHRETTN
jgi:F-type H+-transporting ATPase subunit b